MIYAQFCCFLGLLSHIAEEKTQLKMSYYGSCAAGQTLLGLEVRFLAPKTKPAGKGTGEATEFLQEVLLLNYKASNGNEGLEKTSASRPVPWGRQIAFYFNQIFLSLASFFHARGIFLLQKK